MHPVLFQIGPFTGYSYGFMIAVGAILAIFVSELRARRRGLDGDLVFRAALIGLFAGLLGAKLTFLLSNMELLFRDPKAALGTDGFTVLGGVLLGILAGLFVLARKGVSLKLYADLILPQIALAQGFGRIGCHLAGCCYGKETHSAIGVMFPPEAIAPNGVTLWPTQLMSAAGNFLIFLILLLLSNYATDYLSTRPNTGESGKLRFLQPGSISGLYLILYSLGRFAIEFFRDDPRKMALGLTSNQYVCFVLLFVGTFLVAFAYNRARLTQRRDN